MLFMTRPLVPLAAAFLFGVFISARCPLPGAAAIAAAGALVLAGLALAAHRAGGRRAALAALLGVFLSAGIARLALARRPDPRDVASWSVREGVVELEGVIGRAPEAF